MKVPHVDITKSALMPGDSLAFTFSNIHYTLYATGVRVGSGADYSAKNYKLYLRATNGSRTSTQLIVTTAKFDGTLTSILFIGDIDGDTKVDLIIDDTSHYNAFVPTLFLSKPADRGKLIKLVGQHVSVGC